MEFTDQMATKLLAHAIRHLGQAVNEALCAAPDKAIVRRLVQDAREALGEFEDAYFESPDAAPPASAVTNNSAAAGTERTSR